MRALLALLLLIVIAAGSIFYLAHRETAPLVTIEQPERVIGQAGTLTVSAETPGRKFTQFDATLGIHPTVAEESVTMREKAS